VATLVIVSPGPDTALTIRNTLLGGPRAGRFTAAGISAGQVTWAIAASAGIAGLAQAWSPALGVVRLIGAAYLAFLGGRALVAAFGPLPIPDAVGIDPGGGPLSAQAALRQGFVSDATNPKMAVFFASLLPQFAPPGAGLFEALLPLGVTFAAMTFAWLSWWVWALGRLTDLIRRPAVRRGLEAVTGGALIGLGAAIALGAA
jgi:threonine/homoserine/homoserine lactone efflux protein